MRLLSFGALTSFQALLGAQRGFLSTVQQPHALKSAVAFFLARRASLGKTILNTLPFFSSRFALGLSSRSDEKTEIHKPELCCHGLPHCPSLP